ncbi:hypothetical protein ACVI1N_004670 [Sinorhizobium medicae]
MLVFINVDDAPELLARFPDALDQRQAMNRIDIDMASDMRCAMRGQTDRMTHRLAVRIDADLQTMLAFEIDTLTQDCGAVVDMPRHAPGRLVEMGMRIDQPGGGDGVAAIFHGHAWFRFKTPETGDLSVPNQDIAAFACHGPDVAEQKVVHGTYLSFGLRASRSQSPSMLTATTSMQSCRTGKRTIHQEPENRNWLPIRISVPRDGWLGGMPMPRNESVASVRIAMPKLRVAATMIGVSVLGRM